MRLAYLAALIVGVSAAPPDVALALILAFASGVLFWDTAVMPEIGRVLAKRQVEAAAHEREHWISFFDNLPDGFSYEWSRLRLLVMTYGWDTDAWSEHAKCENERAGDVLGVQQGSRGSRQRSACEARDQAEP